MPTKTAQMIKFRPIAIDDRARYESLLAKESIRGCEFSFANLYVWGRQNIAFTEEGILLFSQFDRRSVYPYPIGGDRKTALDAIIADARARGIPCRITGLSYEAIETIETLYPQQFRFHCDEGAYDYVYDINDLADLKGKNYQKKRNHLRRFQEAYPDYRTEPIGENNIPTVRAMLEDWYEDKLLENPHHDFHMEKAALNRALCHYEALSLDGLLLLNGNTPLAFTIGSRLSHDTLDVHFEKAGAAAPTAYVAINYEFARYIREKYPDIRYLDREEDMGLEGLRKAKKSYYPHHMIEKCWACLLEDGYDY